MERMYSFHDSRTERFLGSGILKGVNKVLAKRIVDYFATDTIRVIEDEPYLLTEVPDIAVTKAKRIVVIYWNEGGCSICS